MTRVNNHNDGKAIKFHLPVLWSPWILCVLAPPLPLCFGDGGICVQVAALWQLMTCYRKQIITAPCRVRWGLKIGVLCQQKSFLSSIDLIRAFKDLCWMIVYFSLQNASICWLELPCETPLRWPFQLLHFLFCLLNWMEKQQSLPIQPMQYHTWRCVLSENLWTNQRKQHHHLK